MGIKDDILNDPDFSLFREEDEDDILDVKIPSRKKPTGSTRIERTGLSFEDVEWKEQGTCVGFWYIYDSLHPTDIALQRKMCDLCPVQRECLEYAMYMEGDVYYRALTYGGLTANERRKLSRTRKNAKK